MCSFLTYDVFFRPFCFSSILLFKSHLIMKRRIKRECDYEEWVKKE